MTETAKAIQEKINSIGGEGIVFYQDDCYEVRFDDKDYRTAAAILYSTIIHNLSIVSYGTVGGAFDVIRMK